MHTLAFVLGKNPELSIAEVLSYLSARDISPQILAQEKDFLILKIAEENPAIKIDDLGGSIKICKIVKVSDSVENLDIGDFFNLNREKLTFGLSFYNAQNWHKIYPEIGKYFKGKLKDAGIKSGCFHLPENRSWLSHVEVINKNLLENGETVFCFSNGKYYIGKTAQVHNPFEFQKRDIGRPNQRPIFSIPPRLAKIMVNLLGIKEGTILDPFCGIGTILQEAALMGFDIMGVDIDKNCIVSARKNLGWLKKEYNLELKELDKKIITGDSRHLSEYLSPESIDGIATEPYLGPPLRGQVDKKQAEKIISNLEDLYRISLKEINKILKTKGRVCIISPGIKIRDSAISLDMGKISRSAGFKAIDVLKNIIPHNYPLTDSEERHRLIREINVLEKM